jgi:predicted Zn finger-like uncharacterized protein
MIVACPSCATRYDLPPGSGAEDGAVIRCTTCDHSWIEASAIEITDLVPHSGALIECHPDVDDEVRRIGEEARQARLRFQEKKRNRQRRLAGWTGLMAACALPLALAVAVPDRVVAMAPATMRFYAAAGVAVNVRGFDIRNVENQFFDQDGTRVLAIKGDIVNIAGSARKVPSMRFVLRAADGSELYAWTLASVGSRLLGENAATNFVTRITAPPEGAENIEIRFARSDELGTTARP